MSKTTSDKNHTEGLLFLIMAHILIKTFQAIFKIEMPHFVLYVQTSMMIRSR